MAALVKNPAQCEVQSVIRYLTAKDLRAADIHKLCGEIQEDMRRKRTVTLFWDQKGGFWVDLLDQGETRKRSTRYKEIFQQERKKRSSNKKRSQRKE